MDIQIRTPVNIKYATTRVPKRRASKARGGRIPLSIRLTSNIAGVNAAVADGVLIPELDGNLASMRASEKTAVHDALRTPGEAGIG